MNENEFTDDQVIRYTAKIDRLLLLMVDGIEYEGHKYSPNTGEPYYYTRTDIKHWKEMIKSAPKDYSWEYVFKTCNHLYKTIMKGTWRGRPIGQ